MAVLLAFGGLVSAKQGIDVKASVLFGTKLDVDDVAVGNDGETALEWTWEDKYDEDGDPAGEPPPTDPDEYELSVINTPDTAKKHTVSPEEEGYPILLEATYGIDNFQIGGFWLSGFKAEGSKEGKVPGLDQEGWDDLLGFSSTFPTWNDLDEQYDNDTITMPSMVFLPDTCLLPGLHLKESFDLAGDSTALFDETGASIEELPWTVLDEPVPSSAEGASTWKADVSFSLANYGGNVGYKLFEQDNVSAVLMAGLEQLKWEQEVNIAADEIVAMGFGINANYDVWKFDEEDEEYVLKYKNNIDELEDVPPTSYASLVETLYEDDADNLLSVLNEALGLEDTEMLTSLAEVANKVDLYLTKISIDDLAEFNYKRDLKITRELEYDPTGYSIGASVGGEVADKLRVRGAFSLGWFSGDAVAKLTVEDKSTPSITEPDLKGKGTWIYAPTGEDESDPLEIDFTYGDSHPGDEGVGDLLDQLKVDKTKTDNREYADTKVTLTKAQVSAEYDVTDSVFLGGGFFYSQWKDMPVLSNKSALEIEKQDLVASGVNVEVGVRF